MFRANGISRASISSFFLLSFFPLYPIPSDQFPVSFPYRILILSKYANYAPKVLLLCPAYSSGSGYYSFLFLLASAALAAVPLV